jgi:hypothetical protein
MATLGRRALRAGAAAIVAGSLAGGCVAGEAARERNEAYENMPPETWPSQRLIPRMRH